MNKLYKLFFTLTLCNLVVNCNNFSTQDKGQLYIGVNFPQKKSEFGIKKIPDNTEFINVEITDDNYKNKTIIEKPINFNLTRQYSKKFIDVSGGSKSIKAEAFNKNNQLIGLATGSIYVIPKTRQSITLLMNEVFPIEPTPTPITSISPTATPTPDTNNIGINPNNSPSSSPNSNVNITPSSSPTPIILKNDNGTSSGSSSGGGTNNPSVVAKDPINVNVTIPSPSTTPSSGIIIITN